MSEHEELNPPLLGRHRVGGGTSYRRVIGAHRAQGLAGPPRGYLLTVALLAGTASMPILAAISADTATIGGTALPDGVTPFIPPPSVGPVVVPQPPTAVPAPPPPLRLPAEPAAPTGWRALADTASPDHPTGPHRQSPSPPGDPVYRPPVGPSPRPSPDPSPRPSGSPAPGPGPTGSPD
ncbi:hypothetical protein GSF22_07485, partial [Micromonospora echinofusca]|nr:hypothetical protein [Micromonospora echinofusca]